MPVCASTLSAKWPSEMEFISSTMAVGMLDTSSTVAGASRTAACIVHRRACGEPGCVLACSQCSSPKPTGVAAALRTEPLLVREERAWKGLLKANSYTWQERYRDRHLHPHLGLARLGWVS
jgi:hypothetical protein